MRELNLESAEKMAIGSENLNLMQLAPKYVGHIGSMVSDAIQRSGVILELGSGDGYQTSFVMAPNENFYCVEPDAIGRENLTSLGYQVSESLENFVGGQISCVFSINCLEHIENDSDAVKQIGNCLKENGSLVLYVPALNFLYSSMDSRVGHFRRYSRKSLKSICQSNGFDIEKIVYVDSLGVLITLMFKVFGDKNGVPSERSLIFFDKYIFPTSCFFDRFLNHLAGKNLFLIARKNT